MSESDLRLMRSSRPIEWRPIEFLKKRPGGGVDVRRELYSEMRPTMAEIVRRFDRFKKT